MDPERMDFLFDLYQSSNNIKRDEYESIYRSTFFNREIFLKEADKMIQNYNFQINLDKI